MTSKLISLRKRLQTTTTTASYATGGLFEIFTPPPLSATTTTPAAVASTLNGGWAHVIAGLMMLILGVFGLVINLSTIMKMLNNRAWRTSFGNFCVSHLTADTLACLIFIGWSSPLAIIKDPAYGNTPWNNRVGLVSVICWEVSIYTQFFIAANRLCAIARPFTYKTLFSDRNTTFMIGIIWGLGCCHGAVFLFPDCEFTFDPSTSTWVYSSTPCGATCSFYIGLVLGLTMLGSIAAMDLMTFYFLQRQHQSSVGHGAQPSEETKRNRRIEKKFYVQAVILGAMFAMTLIFFHLFALVFTNPWGQFICTTIMWEVSHVSNGLILTALNSEFHHIWCGRQRSTWKGVNSEQATVQRSELFEVR